MCLYLVIHVIRPDSMDLALYLWDSFGLDPPAKFSVLLRNCITPK